MSKTKILIFLPLLIFLAGCVKPNEDTQAVPKIQEQKTDDSYVSSMLNIKNKAEKDIQQAAETKNNQINNAMNENEQDFSYIEKYSGATLNTNLGKITLKFFPESAPKTVNNFLKLAAEGFYDGTRFHRVIKDFMIQSGDPNSKNDSQKSLWGTGGPGYKFADELTGKETYTQGTLAMANSGPDTNGSQFFIVTASPGYPLPPSYTVFGEVSQGLDTALKIQEVKTDSSNRPLENVTIESIELIEK